MTRRDYVLIAAAVAATRAEVHGERFDEQACHARSTLDELTETLADRLADTNPRFDRSRFVDACGTTTY